MSLFPMLWALKSAPVADAEERVILVTMAESAWSDGTDAFQSKKTIAELAKIDPKTVQRRLKAMAARGLISLGNQQAAAYIPEHLRPHVYDLLIPYSWFPDIDQINAERKAKGKPPLTPHNRPDLADAPPKRQRADKGRRKKTVPKRAGTTSPRGEDSQSPGQPEREGGTTSPERGDYKSITRGLVVPQPSPSNPPQEPSPSSLAAVDEDEPVAGDTAQQGGGGGDAPQQQEQQNLIAAALVDRLPFGARLPSPQQRRTLITLTDAALKAGWSDLALKVQLTEETANAKSLVAVYRHRLNPENLPAAPPLPKPRTSSEGTTLQATGQYVRCRGAACGHRKMLPTEDGFCTDCREDAMA